MKSKTNRSYRYQYAVKFICTSSLPGTSQDSGAFVPGNYQTAVNVHNPWEKDIKFRMKLATPGVISKFLDSKLGPDEVDRITCKDVERFDIISIHGFEGFLVIESSHKLDVVAVYTAAGVDNKVSALDVEPVRGRKI